MKSNSQKLTLSLTLLVFLVSCTLEKDSNETSEEMVTTTEIAEIKNEPILREQWVLMPFESFYTEQTVEVVDSFVVLEGDIIVGLASDTTHDFTLELAVDPTRKWPNGIIPYSLSKSHSSHADIIQAINEINSKTNLRLIPKKGRHQNYVRFVSSNGCSSWVGMKGGGQNINIGACSKGSIMHEILHAAGFYHEHTRTDRDDYVSINFDRIEKRGKHNFNRYIERGRNGNDLGPYDYHSIMHYSSTAFSKNGQQTIEIKSPPGTGEEIIGQREGLSSLDIKNINITYPK